MFNQQLDVFGGATDIAPTHQQDRLFTPVRVMEGQTTMATGRPVVTISQRRNPVRGFPSITTASVTVNGRSTWGYHIRCDACGIADTSTAGSSVSHEDGPHIWAREHETDCRIGRFGFPLKGGCEGGRLPASRRKSLAGTVRAVRLGIVPACDGDGDTGIVHGPNVR